MPPRWTGTFVSTALPQRVGDPALYFRREFTVAEGLRRATLYVTALGIVEPYLNDTRVGTDVLAPSWTSYRHRINVSAYDLTSAVRNGVNAFGAIVGEGWAVGRIGFDHKRHHYSDRPALYAQIELEYQDRLETIATDAGFRVGTGPVRANGIYDGETYDGRLELGGWSAPGFDDTGWDTPTPVDWDLTALGLAIGPPIRRIQELEPAAVMSTPNGRTVVDFGQVLSGWVRLTVTGPTGRTITLRHAELLDPSGEPEYETLRTAQATDRYVLRGTGAPEVWEPRFTFHGFRYVDVEGWPGTLSSDDLRAVVVHTDMPRTGWFTTSNELLDRLHENVVWSMRGNFVGVPTDCPQRDERLGWTGDLNAFGPTAAFLYDVRATLGSWLDDLAAEQAEKGTVPWVVPDVLSTPSAPTALWSDVAVHLPWTLYWEYGDLRILERQYDSMAAFVRQVEDLLDESGLWSAGHQFGDWLDPDAPPNDAAGGKTDRHLVANAYFCETTRIMAETAVLLDRGDDALHFAAVAERVRRAFRREYVTPQGRLVSDSATAYALALSFGLLDDAQRRRAGDRLAALVEKSGYTVSTGFAGTPLVAQALTDTGHLDTAYLLLTETDRPSFLYPVTMGATTIWERWDAVLPDGSLNSTGMTSLNHYALGAVARWLHRVVGGLEATSAGYREMRIAPRPGADLTFARVVHETVRGRVAVDWRIDGADITLDVEVPAGTRAVVALPLHPEALEEQVGAGSHSWTYAIAADGGAHGGYTMDSTVQEVAANPAAWRAVSRVIGKHVPFPIDGSAPEAATTTFSMVVQFTQHLAPDLESDLRATLASL